MSMRPSHFVATHKAPALPAPASDTKLATRLRDRFFGGWLSGLLTALISIALVVVTIDLARWGLLNAIFVGGEGANAACRAVEGQGACWPVVTVKARLVLFGLYPFDQQFRPAIACTIAIVLYGLSAIRRFWRPWLASVWLVGAVAAALLMWGGVFGLPFVPDNQWGGLPVTLILSTLGIAIGFPIAILLALARGSDSLPALRGFAVAYIELARGVPLVTVLFMASVMVPLFLPDGINLSKLLRVQTAFALFVAAYLAEVVRGGLQAIPRGQYEAADALGFDYWNKMRLIILPQALRLSIPGIVNTFISFFKATSIVIVVGIFDLMTAAKRSVVDPQWQGFGTELYLFVGLIYFAFCFSMSRYSRWLEHQLQERAR
jgi:general L-amino acid transport system permease protein